MAEFKKIGYFYYDEDYKIGACPKCGKDMYDDLYLIRHIKLTEEDKQKALLGLLGVAFCPYCYHTYLFRRSP